MRDLSLWPGLFVVVLGLLSSCGVRVFSSLVVAHMFQGSVVGGMWTLVEAREFSSCGMWA